MILTNTRKKKQIDIIGNLRAFPLWAIRPLDDTDVYIDDTKCPPFLSRIILQGLIAEAERVSALPLADETE